MRGKILAVDDDPEQLALMDCLLSQADFEVDTAANGLDAMERFKYRRPDLILVDAKMPKMDGFAFCGIIRKDARNATLPIIMVTGMHFPGAQLKAFAHGANAIIFKPFFTDELLAKINELMPTTRISERAGWISSMCRRVILTGDPPGICMARQCL
jgi:chemosensory pili system protein ChpA (sensor histidine kinase/response regulator)